MDYKKKYLKYKLKYLTTKKLYGGSGEIPKTPEKKIERFPEGLWARGSGSYFNSRQPYNPLDSDWKYDNLSGKTDDIPPLELPENVKSDGDALPSDWINAPTNEVIANHPDQEGDSHINMHKANLKQLEEHYQNKEKDKDFARGINSIIRDIFHSIPILTKSQNRRDKLISLHDEIKETIMDLNFVDLKLQLILNLNELIRNINDVVPELIEEVPYKELQEAINQAKKARNQEESQEKADDEYSSSEEAEPTTTQATSVNENEACSVLGNCAVMGGNKKK